MAQKKSTGKSATKKVEARKRTVRKGRARVVSSAKAALAKRKAPVAKVQAKPAPKPAVAKAPVKPAPTKPIAGKPLAAAAKAVQARPQAAATKPAAGKPPVAVKPGTAAMKAAMAAAARPSVPVGARSLPAAAAKPAGQKISAPAAAAKPAAAAAQAANKKPVNQRHGFKTNEWIVYPAHGVGRIVTIEEQEIAGLSLELFVITFEKDKMTLRVPTGKSASVGMRKLADENIVKRAMETLKGRARIKRTMWSRRAQEYEAKINSGDLIAIAEVVRDLYRSESQPEQSYSERQLYEAALDRMAREIAAVEKIDERGAVQRITDVLAKSAKGRRIAAEEAEVKAA
jgi:CarD family transcriptional regulator